jgi:uncharacterized delta-60 repeat protein
VQPDGDIVVAARTNVNGTLDFAVLRLLANGSLDATFAVGGADGNGVRVQPVTPASDDWSRDVIVASDGDIVLAGQTWVGAGLNDIAVVRLDGSGELDTSFSPGGTDGSGITVFGIGTQDDAAVAVAEQPDGDLVLAGRTTSNAGDMLAARLLAEGSLDPTFAPGGADGNGIGSYDFVAGEDMANDLAVSGVDGTIVLAGFAKTGANDDIGILRLTPTGALDATFAPGGADGNGRGRYTLAAHGEAAMGVLLQDADKILVGGFVSMDGVTVDLMFARVDSAGTLDPTFAPGGADGDGRLAIDIQGGAFDWPSPGHIADGGDGRVLMAASVASDVSVLQLAGGSIPDFAGAWTGSRFGACLHTLSGATADWTTAGNGNCIPANTANWNAIPATTGTTEEIAHTTSAGAAGIANLRFGLRIDAAQTAGSYEAPITFTVVAPG